MLGTINKAEVDMRKLNGKQIEELLTMATNAKNEGNALVDVFSELAKKYGVSAGGVRNLYYSTIKKGNAGELTARKSEVFTKEEENRLLKKILLAKRHSKSIREACLSVAQGDKKLAMRYQNKYCSMLKNERSTVMREILLQKQIFGSCYNPYATKSKMAEKRKLKREIDDLIKKIGEKCAEENRLLKKKLALYQKYMQDSESGGKEEKQSDAKKFLVKSVKNKLQRQT